MSSTPKANSIVTSSRFAQYARQPRNVPAEDLEHMTQIRWPKILSELGGEARLIHHRAPVL